MKTAALDISFENQLNHNIVILLLQAELDARGTKMTDADMNDAEDTRKPHLTSDTSPSFSYAVVVGPVPSFAESATRGVDIVATCHEIDFVMIDSKSVNVMSVAPGSFGEHVNQLTVC